MNSPVGQEYRCRVRAHGKHQLELKVSYPIPQRSRVRYVLEANFFVPPQLQVNEASYGTRRFLGDLHSHTRHTAPHLTIDQLLSDNDPLSPLVRLRRYLDPKNPSQHVRADHELRMLANACRAVLRAGRRSILSRLDGDAGITQRSLGLYADAAARLLAATRELYDLLESDPWSRELRKALRWCDEWISWNVEQEFLRLYRALSTSDPDGLGKLRRVIVRERRYRKRQGWLSRFKPGKNLANEKTLYNHSSLKKWVQGGLYMSTEPSRTSARIGQLIAAVAAAAAMSFAVAATFLAGRLFASYSIPWALLVVVAYIFKDRIKEILRGALSGALPRLFADRGGRLRDPDVQRYVGTTRESVRFSRSGRLAADLRQLRMTGTDNELRPVLAEEDVICYTKRVRVSAGRLQRAHSRLESITEILRIDIDRWFGKMDDATSRIADLDDDVVRDIEVRRVYHVHVIIGLIDPGSPDPPRRHHYRLVVSRDGVQRVERRRMMDSGEFASVSGR